MKPAILNNMRTKLTATGLWPSSKLALIAWYLLGIDVVLFGLQRLLGLFHSQWAESLGGWVAFLSFLAIIFFCLLAIRWLKAKMLWRLRNRLIVTYVFIGVIPVVMLVILALLSFYLFAGQFATFIVTTGLNSELTSLTAVNSALAHHLAAQIERDTASPVETIEFIRKSDKAWGDRQVCVRLNDKLVLNSVPTGSTEAALDVPAYAKNSFHAVVRDHDGLYLRALDTISLKNQKLTVLSSEPFDKRMLQDLATNLGEVTLYATGLSLSKVDQPPSSSGVHITDENKPGSSASRKGEYVLDTRKGLLEPTYTVGNVPPPTQSLDRQVSFPTTVFVVDWQSGDISSPAGISVQTRVSKLYERLFGALGEFAPSIEFALLFIAIIFAVIEAIALLIGTRLTRTVTGAVAQLYEATKHINRGDFSHRISVKSSDQIATLANSFNSMTASLEKLIEEQKEKQRLENELVIAQEVQAQLFPREISQLRSLEVHGFCKPARTVSGDYYDFLAVDSDRLVLAVGDISGKGISAALLMATIHSAVRAYSLQDIPALREPVAVGATANSSLLLASGVNDTEVSPGLLLALLNHQLYESTPPEKYATLFLGIYNGVERRLVYSNGGHLPPIIMAEDGSVRRLEQGGTVVGLFDQMNYEEGSVPMQSGEIFLAYSDGVTEPENDFGEFGETRLIELVRENRDLPLTRISEIVISAVADWIGAKEQPDDVTLVLARAR